MAKNIKYSIILTILFLGQTSLINAAGVQWASKLLGFSSQRSAPLYSALQALGKPSVMPVFGMTPCAWMPKEEIRERQEYLFVSFETPIYVRQIAVAENNVVDAITKIIIYDSLNHDYTVYDDPVPKYVKTKGRMFNLIINKTAFRVCSLSVVLKVTPQSEGVQIDAIGISDTTAEIRLEINTYKYENEKYMPENLGTNVNSIYNEICPIISPDGRTIYFTRDGHPENLGPERKQDVWYSAIDSGHHFTPAKNLGLPINNDNNNFVLSLTPDGNAMLLGNTYETDGTMKKGISISKSLGDGEWSVPETVVIDSFYNNNDYTGGYCLSSNRKFLLMSIERKDSYGGLDIYVSFLENDGRWTEPKNLGPDINTAANEDSPFLASDGVSLYFSTSGRCGYGSNDMFLSRRLDSTWTRWSEPENLGPYLNTSGWDAFYTIPASGEYAYYVSDQNTIGKDDIFRVLLPDELRPKPVSLVEGKVINSKSNKPLGVKIKYETLPDGIEAGIAISNPLTGSYKIVLPAGFKYGFLAQADGFASVNEFIDLTNVNKYQEVHRDLLLVPIESGQTIRINNIFFDFDKYDLLEGSFSELNRLVELLNKNPKISIIITGHTDNFGTREYNKILSQRRAESVSNFLKSKGISKKRLKTRGYGLDKPIDTNETEEGRQKNRRVEFTIARQF